MRGGRLVRVRVSVMVRVGVRVRVRVRRSLRGGRLSKARPTRVSGMAEQDLPGVCARLGFEACVAYR